MGWVTVSVQELKRVEVLSQVLDGSIATVVAAAVLGISPRQVQRLARRMREHGAGAVRHGARGQPSNHRIGDGVKDFAIDLINENYADFGPTLAAEKLEELHGLKVSRETVRKWMVSEGLWLSRSQRRRFHQPRLRRQYYGELIQIDGSDHRWFEDRAPACTLLVFVDDATGTLMMLRFVPSESTFSYFEALELYLQEHGRPVAFYSDKHTVFRSPRPDGRTATITQFGRALSELNIEILCANSSQAKGRVERANRTLQDRLVKELRLAGISDIEAGNAFLPGFMAAYNQRFAREPARPDNLHRALNVQPDRLAEILCLRDQRYVTNQLSFSFERQRIMLEETELSRTLVGKYVDSYAYADGRLEFRWKGFTLPYKVFDTNQRVTHAAMMDNKRLSAALAYVMAEQEANPVKTVTIGRQRAKYEPTGKPRLGRRPTVAMAAAKRAATAAVTSPPTE